MVSVNELNLATELGSARPYAVELGITDFSRPLKLAELVFLLFAEYIEQQGLKPAVIMKVLHWVSGSIDQFMPGKPTPPEVITFLDKRWVLTNHASRALDLSNSEEVDLSEVPPPVESLAVSLYGLCQRRVDVQSG